MNRFASRPALSLLMLLLSALAVPSLVSAKSDVEQARQLIEQKQIPEARRALERDLRMHPGNLETRYLLAVLLQDIDHQSEAETLYRKNLERSWHLPSLINLAALLQRRGEVTKAQAWLESATKHMRHEAAPWYLLAAISEQNGDSSLAREQFRQATRADPLNGFAWLRFATFQARNHLDDSGIKYAKKAIRLLADCAICWRKYGDIMTENHRNRDALTAYQRSLAIHPDAGTRQQLINTLRRLGQRSRADRMQQALDAWRKYQSR